MKCLPLLVNDGDNAPRIGALPRSVHNEILAVRVPNSMSSLDLFRLDVITQIGEMTLSTPELCPKTLPETQYPFC